MATLTITLPDDLADDIRALVAAGAYPDEGAVIADWLRGPEEPPELTAWLQREVPARLAALEAGKATLLTSDEVRAELDEWRAARR
jgi:antitoxin ParD1/3/4